MATSNYTPKLHLSAWADSDRPKRADFVSDNSIIDTELGGHIENSAIHVTEEEKAKLTEPYISGIYAGSGESERTIQLSFAPRFAIVYKRNAPPVAYSSGVTLVNSGYAFYGRGGTAGVSLTTAGVVVTQTAADSSGIAVNLNESGGQYTVVAFK